jgi:hypothetical protein
MLAQFVLFDGFDPLNVIAPFEVFSAASASPTRLGPSWPRPTPACPARRSWTDSPGPPRPESWE